jgi:hypothetical protein
MFSIINRPKILSTNSSIPTITVSNNELNNSSLLSIKQRQQLLKYLEHKKYN